MDHAVRVQREITAIKPLGPSRLRRITTVVLCVALLGASAYSWIAKPEFIWGASATVSPHRQDAEMRFGMFLLAQRLEAFRAQTGHYPAALGDIGESVEGLSYRLVTDSVFELQALTDTGSLVMRSDQPMDVFLGNSVQLIQRGTP